MRKLYLLLLDLLIVAVSPFLAQFVRDNFYLSLYKFEALVPYAVIGTVVAAVFFAIAGTHRSFWRHVSLHDFNRILFGVVSALAVTVLITFNVNRLDGVARSIPVIQCLFIIAIMCSIRLAARRTSRIKTRGATTNNALAPSNIIVVGLGVVTELYLRSVEALGSKSISVLGLLDESPTAKGRHILGHEVVGVPAELPQILTKFHIHGVDVDRIVIAVPFHELAVETQKMLADLEQQGTISIDRFEERLGFGGTHENSGYAAAMVEEENNVIAGELPAYSGVKRVVDLVCALALLVVLSPIIILATVLVAIDVGYPFTFWQQRPGRNGKPFNLYKFRTMRPGHNHLGERISDEKRLSAIGRFLRRTRLDELAQLYNILAGEMSFVGPRPLLPVDQPKKFKGRLSVRPGLTGWAQVHGGKSLSQDDKAILDLWYIRNQSFALDVLIVLKTIYTVVFGEREYSDIVARAYADLGYEQVPANRLEGAVDQMVFAGK